MKPARLCLSMHISWNARQYRGIQVSKLNLSIYANRNRVQRVLVVNETATMLPHVQRCLHKVGSILRQEGHYYYAAIRRFCTITTNTVAPSCRRVETGKTYFSLLATCPSAGRRGAALRLFYIAFNYTSGTSAVTLMKFTYILP